MYVIKRDGRTAAFDGLQKDAPAVAQHSGDATTGVVLARLRQDGFNGGGRGIDRATGVQQTYQHGQCLPGMSDRNSRRRLFVLLSKIRPP